jgi:hypothetical protein
MLYFILVALGVPDTEQNSVAWFPSSTSPGIVIDTANKPSKTNEKTADTLVAVCSIPTWLLPMLHFLTVEPIDVWPRTPLD